MNSRTRIKICGVSRPEDVEAAAEAGADAVGFVFHPGSPREITVERASALARLLPPFVTPVALFADAAGDRVAAAIEAMPSIVLQFHGDEAPAECASFGRPYLKAARMTAEFDLLDFARRHAGASGLVLDAHAPGYGGAGKVFDWSLVPRGVNHRLVLSGGLHAGNVGSGISALRPHAVDVSSGVESSRGVKDAAAIRRFCDAVREADSRIDASVS